MSALRPTPIIHTLEPLLYFLVGRPLPKGKVSLRPYKVLQLHRIIFQVLCMCSKTSQPARMNIARCPPFVACRLSSSHCRFLSHIARLWSRSVRPPYGGAPARVALPSHSSTLSNRGTPLLNPLASISCCRHVRYSVVRPSGVGHPWVARPSGAGRPSVSARPSLNC